MILRRAPGILIKKRFANANLVSRSSLFNRLRFFTTDQLRSIPFQAKWLLAYFKVQGCSSYFRRL